MAHIRKQLRDKVKTLLITALSMQNVFTHRTHALQADELPAVIIRTNRESSESSSTTEIDRDIELTVEIREKSYSNVDDLLDALCVKVENGFRSDTTINADYMDLVSTDIDIVDGDQPIGIATLVYQVRVINALDPETVI